MAYTLDIADAVARTVAKFATLNAYQLAGHVANLQFWQGQVRNALDAIDGFSSRRRKLVEAEKHHVRRHDTRRFFPDQMSPKQLQEDRDFPEDAWPLDHAKPDSQQVDPNSLKDKRREVADAFYGFLVRCHKEQLVSAESAKKVLAECGIGVEPGDFRD